MYFDTINNFSDFCLEIQDINPIFEELPQQKENSFSSNYLNTINNYNFEEEQINFKDENSIPPLCSGHEELDLIGEIEKTNTNYLLQNENNSKLNKNEKKKEQVQEQEKEQEKEKELVQVQEKVQEQEQEKEEKCHQEQETRKKKKKLVKRIKWRVKSQTNVLKKKRNNKKTKKKKPRSQLPQELLALKPPKKRAQLNKLNIEMTKYESYQLRSLTKEQLGQLSKKDKLERKRIRDRISARNARQKQKKYLERLEKHTLTVIKEKDNVKKRLTVLESENSELRIQIERLQQLLFTKPNKNKSLNKIKPRDNQKVIPQKGCQAQSQGNTLKKRRLLTKTQLIIL
ncbi:cyclic amp-responsive element-binding protein 3-like protein [Anaeramoeba flamelloides]|uniref:Cyclic amp-responsive element-binding protein 3-like protein n=1 Tax=Anaeramoeba flamelloides TaxID=1746091 RepID=A0ABQ8Z3H0_9EUKA|nr:cyclic amp-responsive element-binding protein 3-like protein [Anaeramoeba flamelloides]